MADALLAASSLKRKRSPSLSLSAPPPNKSAKTTSQLQINYLARQCSDDLPLINRNDTIPNILDVLSSYSNVLDRHESLASNLGARPLGPILIKRFERCFDAPPEVIASHSHARDETVTPQITWLEVIHFAQSHPSQFALSAFSEGRRVCQFYYPQKQVRVQVNEEDFLFINSGRCQDLIPTLPIWEDEEKEVGTCETLEKSLRELTNAADMVAARTRQLSHRLKGRRMAILERRAGGNKSAAGAEIEQRPAQATPSSHPSGNAGFFAVNNQAAVNTNGNVADSLDQVDHPRIQSPTHDDTMHSSTSVSPGPQAANLSQTPRTLQAPFDRDPLSYYMAESNSTGRNQSASQPPKRTNSHGTPRPNAGKHNFSRPLAPSVEGAQPFRSICQAHMEGLARGSRVMPPCDRCRRLRMDCLKNLTSCAGCTKKHSRCHWREVSKDEVEGLLPAVDSQDEARILADGLYDVLGYGKSASNGFEGGGEEYDDDDGTDSVDDMEALERDADGGVLSAASDGGEMDGDVEMTEKNRVVETMRRDEEGLEAARELSRQAGQGVKAVDDANVARDQAQKRPISPQSVAGPSSSRRDSPTKVVTALDLLLDGATELARASEPSGSSAPPIVEGVP